MADFDAAALPGRCRDNVPASLRGCVLTRPGRPELEIFRMPSTEPEGRGPAQEPARPPRRRTPEATPAARVEETADSGALFEVEPAEAPARTRRRTKAVKAAEAPETPEIT